MVLKFLPDTEMGNLIREKDWEKTSVGPIASWPENLHTALSIIMNSRFPMFLFWGPELISFYNDAYRPSFGNEGMHPKILGLPAQEAWADIWDIVKKFPEQVLTTGIATWEENQLIPIYRNGRIENVYWTFSHSPVYNTSGKIEGIFVLCMETTQEVLSTKKIKESEERFRSMAESASALIAVGDETSHAAYFNKAWIELTGRPMKDLLEIGWTDLVHPKGKDRFMNEYQSAFENKTAFASELRMLNKDNKYSWLLITANPRYYVDGSFAGYISSGVDITEQKRLQQKERKSIRQLNNVFAQAPVAMCILRGEKFTVELANAKILGLWGRSAKEVMHKPLFEVMSETKDQGFEDLLTKVLVNGTSVEVQEMPATLIRKGKKETIYVNCTFEPLRENDSIAGIISTAIDVTEQVTARKKIEQSEHRYNELIHSSTSLVSILKGKDFIIELANQAIINLWGKGPDVIGKSYLTILPELREQGVEKLLIDVFDTGIPFSAVEQPYTLIRDGKPEKKYFNFLFQPQRSIGGDIEGVAIIATEVTTQAVMNKRIEESENRFRLALTGTNQIVFSQDHNLKHTWIYNSHPEFRPENIIGKSDEELHVAQTAKILTDIKRNVLITGHAYDGDVEIEIGGKSAIYSMHIEPIKDGNEGNTGIIGTVIDVTDKVKSQKKIKESEELFSNFGNNIQNLAWIAEGDGSIFWYNQRWLDYTGLTLDEMKGWGWQKVHHPDHIDRVVEISKKLWITNEPFELTFPLRRFDGEYRWFLTRGVPISGIDGQIERWIGTNTDIHEQKISEAEIIYRKALLEAHNEASVDGLLLVDAKGKIISYNKRFVEIWNMPQHIVDAQDDEAALNFAMTQLVNPKQFLEKVKYLYDHPTEISKDILEYKDGKIIERHGYPVVAKDGSYYAWSWTFRDITQQQIADKLIRSSEEKFRLLSDSMPQFVWTGNAKGELNYFNQAVYNYSGLSKETVEREGWLQIVHPDEREENIRQWLHSVETGKTFSFEHRFRRFDGEYKWQLSRAVPQRDANGEIQMWIGTSTEIQQQKEQREELEKLVQERTNELVVKNTELEKMNKELESFTYISSHDLQEPLRKIQTLSSRIIKLETQNLTEQGLDYFQRMQNAAERMQRLIEDLLVFSRTTSGERKFVRMSLSHILDEVKSDLKDTIIDSQTIIETENLCEVDVIPFQFHQLMYNLITNAIKFAKDGQHPHITIHSRLVKGEGQNVNVEVIDKGILRHKEYCHITIHDNGIGFEPQYKDRIFEVFQRLHGGNQYIGTGIGLAIVKKIVENHNGFVSATGEAGVGATFDIFIPSFQRNS